MSTDISNQNTETKQSPLYYRRLAARDGFTLNLRELWQFRELLFFLTWRDIKVRYKQTILGASWAVLQPFLTMIVFSLFFGGMAQIPSDGLPYPIFSYAALVPWTFFSTSITQSANSLVTGANVLKKVYFPRLIMPTAAILAPVVDFVLAFIVLIGMMLFFGILPTANIIWLPLFFLLTFLTALGTGLWLSAMNVQFRDVRYVVPFLTQLWLFITPIAYPSSMIENDILRVIYGLNPMAGVVEGFRWALLGTDTAPTMVLIPSVIMVLVLVSSGLYFFRRMEKTFADVV